MFEQVFKKIDNALKKDPGYSCELDILAEVKIVEGVAEIE